MQRNEERFSRRAGLGCAAFAGCLALAACASSPRQTFDLAAGAPKPPRAEELRSGTAAVIVDTPQASELVDSSRFVIRTAGGELAYLENAQWSDRAPKLVQARLVSALARGGVDAAFPGASGALRLETTLNRFEIDEAQGRAIVEITARLEVESSGARRAAAIFSGEAPAPHTLPAEAAQAFEAALDSSAEAIVRWTRREAAGR
ncbi:MAG TPA: ABC-type transport auxiliary lipoprotein family protein [Methylocystis sp.]|nr:ABC-type transport auxiliary lipoprotein family protein [Methylocystis sp.]HXZ18196.1 ABC-type transport auxiliary lipoprotein family protein [Roseiarcus sp.]